jgi:hypothetical protein
MRYYWVWGYPSVFGEIDLPVYGGCPMWAIHWRRSEFDGFTVYLDVI